MKTSLTRMVKQFIGACSLLVLAQCVQAQFTFPVYEPFSEYPEGERLRTAGSSGTNWNVGNSLSSSSSPIISTNYVLSYPGLSPDPNVPASGILGAQGAGRTHGATFTAQTNGTSYLSFILSVSNLPSADRPIIGLNGNNSGTPNPNSGASIWITPSGQLKIDKVNQTAPLTNTTPSLAIGSTYLVVMAYTFTNGELDLWLNPTVLGNNANVPSPTIFSTNGTSPTTLQSVCLYSGTGIAVSLNLFDEIRVNNNWAGVTPTGPSPGSTFNVTGGGSGCPGDAIPVGLSGSVTTNVYLLYVNSAFSGQVANGTGSAISFDPQTLTGIYNILASNTVSGNVGWMSGSANIFIAVSPSITQEPASVVVATNGYATFPVTATGSGLDYQWYKNGTGLNDGGDVSGSTTPTLTISPAKTADSATAANGYYVIITNSCGYAATSAPNASLTLDAPANIVWQGGNPNTNWDLSTTANFTNSAGALVMFNGGDNVTFDDTSINPIVTLVGVLTPTLITESANQNYAFTGSGNISASASLLMSGSGTLTVSNANNYTGGTTISNGRLVVDDPNQGALGGGPVTLAGGTLEMGLKSGSATVGLSNVNVTANSTLQFNGAGSFAQNIFGALTGSSGATLTIYGNLNNSATADRLRLYGTFTNNFPMVISGAGDEVEIAPYNTNGSQIYNGVISGSGGRFVPRSSGNVIFNNAANTFNDSSVSANGNGSSGYSVLLSSGNVGVGANSVSSSPPTIDSSPLGTGILGIQVGAEGGTNSLFASGGAHTVANQVAYTSTTNTVTLILGGSNNLTLAGEFSLSRASDAFGTNRTLQVTNTGLTVLSGVVDDAGLGSGIIKTGNGVLALNGNDTYTGSTIVSNGMLEGIGTIISPITIETSGTLGAGTTAIGTFNINSNLTLAGNALFKVNKSVSPSNDVVVVSGTLSNTGTGTLTVTNLGPALVAGDRFVLFSEPLSNGGALTVTGAGAVWTNNLAVDGSISVLSTNSIPSTPTNITFSVSSGNITLSWPASYIGWLLQAQTNALNVGLSTNWVVVSGSSTTNSVIMPVNPANPSVFYRLAHP